MRGAGTVRCYWVGCIQIVGMPQSKNIKYQQGWQRLHIVMLMSERCIVIITGQKGSL